MLAHLSLAIPAMPSAGDAIVSPHQETKMTNEGSPNPSDDYKIQKQSLPSQQSTFLTAQWKPPRPLTLHTMSQPSMQGSSLWKSTSDLWISSTTSRISDSMLPPRSHQAHSLPTSTNAAQSLHSSKKSVSASRHLNTSSTSSTRTIRKSSGSTKTQKSPTPRIGEHSHGDHSQNGNNCHWHHSYQPTTPHHSRQAHHQQMMNGSSSQMAPGST